MKNNINLKRVLNVFLAVLVSFTVAYSSEVAVMAAPKTKVSASTKTQNSTPNEASKKQKILSFLKKYAGEIIAGVSVGISAIAVVSIVVAEVKKNRALQRDHMGDPNDLKENELAILRATDKLQQKEIEQLKSEKDRLEKENKKSKVIEVLQSTKGAWGRIKNVFKQYTAEDYENQADAIINLFEKNKNNVESVKTALKNKRMNSGRIDALVSIFS